MELNSESTPESRLINSIEVFPILQNPILTWAEDQICFSNNNLPFPLKYKEV